MVAAAGFLSFGLYFPIGAWTQPFHAGKEPQEGKILARFSHELGFRSTAVSPSCGNYTEVCHRLFDLFDKWMSHSVSSGSQPTLQTVADEMVREQLVAVLSPGTQRHVREQLKLDAHQTAKLADSFVRARTVTQAGEKEFLALSQVSAGQHVAGRRSGDRPPQFAGRGAGTKECGFCGGTPHARSTCPAKDKECRQCGKRGHYERVCRSRRNQQSVSATEVSDTYTDDGALLNTEALFVGDVKSSQRSWRVGVLLQGTCVDFKIDTGADVSVISDALYHQLQNPPVLKPCTKRLISAANTPLHTVGLFTASVTYPASGASAVITVCVVQGLRHALLSCSDSLSLGLIKPLFSNDGVPPDVKLSSDVPNDGPNSMQSAAVIPPGSEPVPVAPSAADRIPEAVLADFPSLFSGLGSLKEPYSIPLTDGVKPFCLYTARNVALPIRPQVEAELQRMESLGVFRRVLEPTDWCAAMVAVPNATGAVRICGDLKPLNDAVRRSHHQLPTVDETLGQIGDSTVFTKLDANSGFWQIPLDEVCQLLTTFITPQGRFCYTKLPFGISSAPEIFQQRMSAILQGLEGVVCQMDDILVHGRTQEEHDHRLRAVLTRLVLAGLTLNPAKCQFSASDLTFLGVHLTPDGIRPDDGKTEAIRVFRTPQSASDVRRFLGLANQLGKFSPHLASISQPLRELLSKGKAWTWDHAQQTAFEATKEELCKPTCLQLYDPNYSTKLSADASSYGLGAVLYQRSSPETTWRPVACASRSLTPAERNYAQIEKEALAITWATSRFEMYLLGMHTFLIETDHKPLVPLLSMKRLHELPARVLRFRLRLARYSYTITHVPGSHLTSANAFSKSSSRQRCFLSWRNAQQLLTFR
eukprot:scpid39753/ scgid0465/ Retrovirus-related Pol polyprotein from transposon 17.6; Protease; Reverse transcriptase; Endonuclease